MQIYYINLDTQPTRRAQMEAQFAKLRIVATRLRATGPQDIPPAHIKKYCGLQRFNPLTAGQLGCILSHLDALKRIAEGTERYGLVLEDDALLSRSLPDFITAFEAAPPEADLIKLDTLEDSVRILRNRDPAPAGVALRQVITRRYCATGYIVDRRAARQIAGHPKVLHRAIDDSLYDPLCPVTRGLRILHADPGLCAQPEHLGYPRNESTIEFERLEHNHRMAKRRMLWLYAILYREALGLQKTYRQFVHGGATKKVIPLRPDLLAPASPQLAPDAN